jgi:hypothetical protein
LASWFSLLTSKDIFTKLFMENGLSTAFLKSVWYTEPGFNNTLLGICVVLFLSVILVDLIILVVKWPLKESRPKFARIAAWVARGVSGLSLLFIVLFAILVGSPDIIYGVPTWFNVALILPWVIALLTLGMIVFAVVSWRQGYWGLFRRLYYTITTLASVGFVWYLLYWNFISLPH